MTALILIIGAALRFFMWLSPKSLWGDEWFTLDLVTRSPAAVLQGALNDVHPPLYFLTARAATLLLGPDERAIRLVSAAAGIGTLFFIYFLAKECFGRKAALAAASLAAVSPYWLQSSNEMRSYSLFGFLVTAGSYAFVRSLRREGEGAAWYAAAATAAVYTEHYAWFWLAGTVATTALLSRRTGAVSSKLRKAQIVAVLAALPSLALILFQSIYREHMLDASRVREYWSAPILAKKIAGIFWHFATGYTFSMMTAAQIAQAAAHSVFFWFSAAATLAAIVLMIVGFGEASRRYRAAFFLALATLIFPVLFLGIFYSIRLDARYLVFAAPFFFLLVSAGLAALSRRWAAPLLALMLSVSLIASVRAILSPTDAIHREDYRSMTEYILKNAPADAVVSGLAPQFEYYEKRLGIPLAARRVPAYADLEHANLTGIHAVWILDGRNMQPEVNRRYKERFDRLLAAKDFRPGAPSMPFGEGEESNIIYFYKRTS